MVVFDILDLSVASSLMAAGLGNSMQATLKNTYTHIYGYIHVQGDDRRDPTEQATGALRINCTYGDMRNSCSTCILLKRTFFH